MKHEITVSSSNASFLVFDCKQVYNYILLLIHHRCYVYVNKTGTQLKKENCHGFDTSQ